ncbi:hypothetical protein [Candidatus Enterovibrio escicola]|uniref:hypothetical protein n=1 Tax=Candidatus Enterovibrio escicola TaxID=1927127 RepID=UPI001681A7FB|nr:hypothetical protein [Candidatus Enterovibrio escacola]
MKYRAISADKNALFNALRPKKYKLQKGEVLSDMVERKLMDDWSPEQVAGWLKITYPVSPDMHISHETIYKTLFVPSRQIFDKNALTYIPARIGRGFTAILLNR